MVRDDFSTYLRMTGAQMDFEQFREIYGLRAQDPKIKIPRAVDRWFQNPTSEIEQQIRRLIDEFRAAERMETEKELFSQKKRLADADRKLAVKPTKAAGESKRIATNKIEKAELRLSLLSNFKPHPSDGRIFPMNYAPIV